MCRDDKQTKSLQDRTDTKLRYAGVHLDELKSQEPLSGEDFDRAHQESFLYHLLGTRDAFLAELNHYYRTGVAHDSLTSGNIRNALKKAGITSSELRTLHELEQDKLSWYCTAKDMRDHSTHLQGVKRAYFMGGQDHQKVKLKHPTTGVLTERHFPLEFEDWLQKMEALILSLRESALSKVHREPPYKNRGRIEMSVRERLDAGRATTEDAIELFDSLEPVDVGFMIGNWKGEGFHTNHPMDGLLEAYHWYGKRFESPEDVHPLVFSTLRGGVANVNPAFMGLSLGLMDRVPMPKSAMVGRIFQTLMPFLTTSRSRARLRMTTYRGKSSATMIYDQLPINDVFRKIDQDAVFGIMDLKRMKSPFFFILRREHGG